MSIATINSNSVTWGDDLYDVIFEVDNFNSNFSSGAVLLEGLHIKVVGKTAKSKTSNIPVTRLKITLTQGREHTTWTYNSTSLFYLDNNESKYLEKNNPYYYYPYFQPKEWFPDEEWSLDNDITTITLEARVDGRTISGTRYLRIPPNRSTPPFLSYAGLGEATEETDPHIIPAFTNGKGTVNDYNFYIINPYPSTVTNTYKVYVTIYPASYFTGGELNLEWDVNKVLLKTVTSNEEIIPITLDLYNEDYLNDFASEDNFVVDNITLMERETVIIFSVEHYENNELLYLTETPYIFQISHEDICPVITLITIKDTNPISANITGYPTSKFIANVSDATYQILASTAGDATIVKYEISSPSLYVESTSPTGRLGVLKDAHFTIKVTDSRGYTRTTTTQKYDIVPYIPLTANIYVRDASTEDRALSHVEVSGKWYEGFLGAGGGVAHSNRLTARIRYKFTTETDWEEWIDVTEYLTITSDTYTADNIYIDIDPNRYREETLWELEVIDKIMTKTSDPYLVSFTPVFDWSGEDFNFNVPVNINGNLTITGDIIINGQSLKALLGLS